MNVTDTTMWLKPDLAGFTTFLHFAMSFCENVALNHFTVKHFNTITTLNTEGPGAVLL